jgi:hypothetical protein
MKHLNSWSILCAPFVSRCRRTSQWQISLLNDNDRRETLEVLFIEDYPGDVLFVRQTFVREPYPINVRMALDGEGITDLAGRSVISLAPGIAVGEFSPIGCFRTLARGGP